MRSKLQETWGSRGATAPGLTGSDDPDPPRPWHPLLLPVSYKCAPPQPPPSPPSAPPPTPACIDSLDDIESKCDVVQDCLYLGAAGGGEWASAQSLGLQLMPPGRLRPDTLWRVERQAWSPSEQAIVTVAEKYLNVPRDSVASSYNPTAVDRWGECMKAGEADTASDAELGLEPGMTEAMRRKGLALPPRDDALDVKPEETFLVLHRNASASA